MSTLSKLESSITIDEGYTISVVDAVGTHLIVLPAGQYYHSSIGDGSRTLAEELEYRINLTATATFTVSMSTAGIYTISATGALVGVIWTNTILRDLMGYTTDLVDALSYTAPNQAQGIWYSSSLYQTLNGGGSWRGVIESDLQSVESASGHVYAVQGRRKRVNAVTFGSETRARTWQTSETVTNESFETFYTNCILGELDWSQVCGPIRWYPDASDDAVYGTYSVLGLQNWSPQQLVQDWTGRWIIQLPRLVEVPE